MAYSLPDLPYGYDALEVRASFCAACALQVLLSAIMCSSPALSGHAFDAAESPLWPVKLAAQFVPTLALIE
jgi:hypothetical protein